MSRADESGESSWASIVRGFDDIHAWNVLRADGTSLVETDPQVAEELLVRYWGTRREMFPSNQPVFLDSLRESVVHPDESAIPHIPRAVGLAAGWISSRELLADLRRGSRRPFTFERGAGELRADETIRASAEPWLAELWHELHLLQDLKSDEAIERKGVRGRLSDLAHSNEEDWTRLLPWLLCLDGPEQQTLVNDLTIELVLSHPGLLDEVRRHETHLYSKVGLRAAGLVQSIRGVAVGDWAVEVAAAHLDRRRDVYPRPLAEPASTWISDRDLEDLIRGAAREAIREFGPIAEAQGRAEEEGLTAALLTCLRSGFKAVGETLQLTTSRRATAPAVSLSQRTVPKKEEKRLRADVCVLVDVQLAGELKIRFGDLVQVKKSTLFSDSETRHESWRIDLEQLRELLEWSPTATYWLLRSDGDVLAVPAKLLLAIADQTARANAKSRTVHYTEIRHAAVSLGSYLCDLMMGMWLGTSNAEMIRRIDGTDARTSPLSILEVTVRRQPQ